MNNGSRFTTAKYIVTAVLVVFVLVMAVSGRESTKSFSEIAQALEARTNSASLQTAAGGDLKRLYGLDPADYEGVLLKTAVSGMSAEELLFITLKDKSQLPAVESAINQRLAERSSIFEGYAPEQARLVEDARIITRGRQVFLVISADADNLSRLFLSSL